MEENISNQENKLARMAQGCRKGPQEPLPYHSNHKPIKGNRTTHIKVCTQPQTTKRLVEFQSHNLTIYSRHYIRRQQYTKT